MCELKLRRWNESCKVLHEKDDASSTLSIRCIVYFHCIDYTNQVPRLATLQTLPEFWPICLSVWPCCGPLFETVTVSVELHVIQRYQCILSPRCCYTTHSCSSINTYIYVIFDNGVVAQHPIILANIISTMPTPRSQYETKKYIMLLITSTSTPPEIHY